MAKISVLVPVYNTFEYLNRCLNSIYSQVDNLFEIIIINNGSTDNSIDIINKYINLSDKFKLINKDNIGYGASLNIGLKEACGDYISIIESDDYIENSMYEKFIPYLNNQNDIVKCSFNFIVHNKIYKKYLFNDDGKKVEKLILKKPSIWSCIYRKDFILNNKISFIESKGASYQDTSFNFKTIVLAQNIKIINEALYNYRIDNPNSSINSDNKIDEIMLEFEEISNFIQLNNKEFLLPYKYLLELRVYLWKLARLRFKDRYNFISRISNLFHKYDLESFFSCDKVSLKEKIKLYLLINFKIIFYLLSIYKRGRNDR